MYGKEYIEWLEGESLGYPYEWIFVEYPTVDQLEINASVSGHIE